MGDLVDLLREKLEHADEASFILVDHGSIAIGRVRVRLLFGSWLCEMCPAQGADDPAHAAAWAHLSTHMPPKRKRWWRR